MATPNTTVVPTRAERFRLSHLLAAWGAYWLGLVVVTLGPAAWAAWPLTRPGSHGAVSASVSNTVASLKVLEGSTTIWNGSAHLGSMLLGIGLPPLALLVLWLATRPRVDDAPAKRVAELPREAAETMTPGEWERSGADLRSRR